MHRLKSLLAGDKPILSAWCGITDTHYLETIAEQAFDAVVLDMQHGFWDESTLPAGISTLVARGRVPLVRLPLERWDIAARALDFGAMGVIAPMINNAGDAQAFVDATRFVPVGQRSYGPRHAASLHGVSVNQYLQEFDQCSLALAMIETQEAYANLDAILAVKGIDGVLIGPTDLSISFRQNPIPDVYGVDTLEVVKNIILRCKKAGKCSAAFSPDVAGANMLSDLAVDIISVGVDHSYISQGVSNLLSGLKFS